ncbi:MAG: energy transducer TonB [Myxococcota bacterium]|nr:energy transducer TonB [Myxococcota bacterium]
MLLRSEFNARLVMAGMVLLSVAHGKPSQQPTKPSKHENDSSKVKPLASDKPLSQSIEPPKLIEHREPAFPSTLQASGIVKGRTIVMLTIDESGHVSNAEHVGSDPVEFFTAFRETLPFWRFEPATQSGKAITTKMKVTWIFNAPVVQDEPAKKNTENKVRLSQVDGRIMSRGIRRVLAGIVIRFEPGNFEAFSGLDGRFTVSLPPGAYKAFIEDDAYLNVTRAIEVSDEPLSLPDWLITPENLDASSMVVFGRQQRETQRVSLDRFELTHVAGTMGDPLRVIQSLPGVGSFTNFLPFPIVRGAPPGDTGYFVDGTSIPLLFHLGIGTSVIHPQLVDQVDFYPGVAPVRNGRFLGGIVEAKTRVAEKDYWVGDLDINLFQTGALLSIPVNDGSTRITLGGRYSYTGLLLTLVSSDAYLNFWDYLARIDHRFKNRHQLKLTVFGAQDEIGDGRDAKNRFMVDFHRFNVQYTIPVGRHRVSFGLDLGADRMITPADEADVEADEEGDTQIDGLREYSIRPRISWSSDVSESLSIETGVDLEVRPTVNQASTTADQNDGFEAFNFISPNEPKYIVGGYHSITFTQDRWQLNPSARFDYYRNVDRTGIDPRVGLRFQQTPNRALKAHVGVAHAQQRFFLPVPGLGDLELSSPLQQSRQVAIGVEQGFESGYSMDITSYFAYRKNLISTRFEDDDGDEREDTMDLGESSETFRIPLQAGRAFGTEIMLRKQRTSRVFGWLAYTLQRIERRVGNQWVIDPLDQTHIANLVISYRLGQDYILGTRLHYNSGRFDLSSNTRLDGYFQADLRFDFLWVEDTYQVDFYVDIINLTYQGEQIEAGESPVKYILPTIGAHGTF